MFETLLLLGRPVFPVVLGLFVLALIAARWLAFTIPRSIFLSGLIGIPAAYLLDLSQTLIHRGGMGGLMNLGAYLPLLTLNLAPYLFALGIVGLYAYPKRARVTAWEPYALLLCLGLDFVWFSFAQTSSL